MNLEALMTPHPSRVDAANPARPLLEAAGIEDIAKSVETARTLGNTAYYGAVMEALPPLCEAVHSSLRFRSIDTPLPPGVSAFDTLAHEQTTHCYGYTVVTSAALSLAGINHWVGIAGNHTFAAIPLQSKRGRVLYMADGYRPELNGDMAYSLLRHTPAEMAAQMNHKTQPRGRALLDLKTFAISRGHETATDFLQRYSLFFSFRASNDARDRRVLIEHEKHPRSMVSTFHPEDGIHSLQQAARFMQQARDGQARDAADTLNSIAGMYPLADAAAPHTDIRQVVATLCEQRSFARARRAIHAYCSSFVESKDSRLAELEGDLWSTAASYKGDDSLAERARSCYRAAQAWTSYAWAASALRKKLNSVASPAGLMPT